MSSRVSPATARRELARRVSLLGAIALVVGNMVGTSVYTLPAALAREAGPSALVSWIVTAVGYLFVAIVYASLGARYPRMSGPYVYAREAFGDFLGFQSAWSYWLSAVVGNAAIVTGVVAYAAAVWPWLASHVAIQFALAQALLWSLCLVNVVGVRESTRVEIAIMVMNLVPLALVCTIALFSFDAANLHPFAPRGFGGVASGAALVVWAFSGVESATVPAEEMTVPGTIRRATLIGYAIATSVFVLIALAVTGALPADVAASSPRPIALVASRVLGDGAARAIGLAAVVAGTGTLNGWILMAGRIPVAAAQDGLFFPSFARIHPRFGTPHVALVVATAIGSGTLFLYFNRSLLGVFELVAKLAVLTTLLPHLYSAAAELTLARRDRDRYTPQERRRAHVIAPIAFVFILFTIYGVGADVALAGFLAVLAGTPLYVWLTTRSPSSSSTQSLNRRM
jgi:APA family basic amino acid/polyamine antiporter